MSSETQQVTLKRAAGDAALPVLVQASSAPIIQGGDPEGFDYLCSGCGSLLVAQTTASSLWDLALECAICHVQCGTPALLPGRALPPRTVVVDPGRYLIGTTISQPSTAAMASRLVVERRQREMGRNPAVGPRASVLGGGMVQALLRQTEQIFAEVLDELERSHRRSMASPTPAGVHPLIRYIEDVRAVEQAFAKDGKIDLSSVIELDSLIGQLKRWECDPAVPLIVRTLANGDDVPHTIAVLTMAGYLADAGNAVEVVVDPDAKMRASDLRIVTSARHHAAVEVKTPVALRGPSETLSTEAAYHAIDQARSSAGTGAGDQLSPDQPGFLVVAGSRLRLEDLDRLETAAEQQLARRGRQRPHIASIVIMNTGSAISDAGDVVAVAGTAAIRPVMSPFYSGEIAVETSQQEWMEAMDRQFDMTPSGNLTAVVDVPASTPASKLGRNEPCWCGSGRKFKRCHGR